MKMTNRHTLKRSRGMTLVEVLIATLIVMVAVLSVSAVYLYSGKETVRAIRQAEAARLVQAIRMYAVQEFVDPATGKVTDVSLFSNADVPTTAMVGLPETLPNRLISSRYNIGTPTKYTPPPDPFVWQFIIAPGSVNKGVAQHTVTTAIYLDSDRNSVVSSRDEPIRTNVQSWFCPCPTHPPILRDKFGKCPSCDIYLFPEDSYVFYLYDTP